MSIMFNIDQFISDHITFRKESFVRKDLLANKEVLLQEIQGKSVLVIGGAGTIGSSFIKSLLKFKPSQLYAVDISENGLTELTRDLRSTHGAYIPAAFRTYPINFNDNVFYSLFEKEGPFDIVANFAAHKHVRSEKDQYSITALLENNVIRAERLLQKLADHPPAHFFCVSTDKAANPVNIMGASKSIMEQVIMAYADSIPITTARFANVAFSNGSLLDGFISRLMKNQPLSAPNDVKRYFVSPEESGEICLLACITGKPGDIFFPKLEEAQMMTFSEIAVHLLHSLGFEPLICETEDAAREKATKSPGVDNQYPVYFFTSDTSGEKPYEEFYTSEEIVDLNSFQSLGIIKNAPRKTKESVSYMIHRLSELLNNETVNKESIVKVLNEFLPNFRHIERGKSLDQKM